MLSSFQHYRCYLTAALCCFTISGCAFTQNNNGSSNNLAHHTATRITYLSDDIASALQGARAGQTLQLGQSPWGSSSSLEINERYFSAAGKHCLSGKISSAAQTEPVVICQYQPQRWGATRALTRLKTQ